MSKGGQKRSKKRAAELAAQRARKAAAASGGGAADAAAILDDTDDDVISEPAYERTAEVIEFWEQAGIEPVEIALPGGVGFTLRHYRTEVFYPEPEVEEPEVEDADDEWSEELGEELPETVRVPDEDEDDEDSDPDEAKGEEKTKGKAKPDDSADANGADERTPDDEAEIGDGEGEAEELVGEEREVVVFLTHNGRLQMFKTARGLADFVASDAPHALADVEAFARVKENIKPELIAPDDDDRYELDLVVRNLRGGRDAWDADLLIKAGEISRDLAYACGLTDTLEALSPGSPLDTLDDALRGSGLRARWKLRRIKQEQVTLAWRSAIGKILGAVDWHK